MNNIVNAINKFHALPRSIKFTTSAYVSYMTIYILTTTYYDSKYVLCKYRLNKLKDINTHENNYDDEIKKVQSDWDAACLGSRYKFYQNVWDSIIWPVTTFRSLVPTIVLALNPAPAPDAIAVAPAAAPAADKTA